MIRHFAKNSETQFATSTPHNHKDDNKTATSSNNSAAWTPHNHLEEEKDNEISSPEWEEEEEEGKMSL